MKVMRDVMRDRVLRTSRPHLVVVEKREKVYMTIYFNVPGDKIEEDKVETYKDLKRKSVRMCGTRRIKVV